MSNQDVKEAIQISLTDPERGFDFPVELDDDALDFIATSTNGDLRSAFNSLDLAVLSTPANDDGIRHITLDIMENSLQRSYITMDKDGDGHYDVLSALQKSIRGSDVDASLHYAARLIEAGDLPSLARRLTVIAYEDIGLANPDAQIHTVTALDAAQRIEFSLPMSSLIWHSRPSQTQPMWLWIRLWLTSKHQGTYRFQDTYEMDITAVARNSETPKTTSILTTIQVTGLSKHTYQKKFATIATSHQKIQGSMKKP